MSGRIPVQALKRIAEEFGLKQVLLVARDDDEVHIVTFGATREDCELVAKAQDFWTGRIRELALTRPAAATSRHVYRPHKKYPYFCDLCGYPQHEQLQHVAGYEGAAP